LPNVPRLFFLAESQVRYGNGDRNSRPTSRNVNVETRTGNQARLPELWGAVLRLESYADPAGDDENALLEEEEEGEADVSEIVGGDKNEERS
jgi:hypothetical protein